MTETSDVNPEDVARRVNARLKKVGLSQNAAAKKFKVPQQTMNRLCLGIGRMSKYHDAVARGLNMPRNYMLYGEGPEWLVDPSLRDRALGLVSTADDRHIPEIVKYIEQITSGQRRTG